MRKLYLFWILVSPFCCVTAQNINIARHSNVDRVSHLVSINSKSFYLEKVEEGLGYNYVSGNWYTVPDSAQVVGLDHVGQVIFKKRFSQHLTSRITSLKTTLDKALVFIGYSWPCDVLSFKNYIVKLDTNGVEQFNAYLPTVDVWPKHPLDFTQHSDSSFYLVSDSILFHVSKTGQFLSRINTGMTGIRTIESLSNGNLLIAGQINATDKLVELTTGNVIVNQQTLLEPIQNIKIASSGKIYGLTLSQNIRTYQSNLSALLCSSLTLGPQILIHAMDVRSDSVFVAGINSNNNELYYAVLSQSLQSVYQTQAAYRFIVPKGITINSKNRVSVISNCSSSTYTWVPFTSLYNFPITGGFSSKLDIGVSNVALSSHTLYSGSAKVIFDVTVKNYSNDTIKGFKLNRYVMQSMCNHMKFNNYYATVILPYDSVTVSTYPMLQPLPSPTLSACFFTSIPNQSNDIETLNDDYCTTLGFYVGVDENSRFKKCAIFPNPFSEHFTVQSDDDMKELELFNALGLSIKKIFIESKTIEIDTEDLPNGIYFLRVETEKGLVVKKVIKN